MPLSAITDPWVRENTVGRVEDIHDQGDGSFVVRVSLGAATTGGEAGQLLNMLFGNSSIHDHISLLDADLPHTLTTEFPGPGLGEAGLRNLVGAPTRPLTCGALKPQGLSSGALAELAYRLALGRLDFIKDDHGLADQAYSPFEERVARVARAIAKANAETGHTTCYVPSLTGNLDQLRHQAKFAHGHGAACVMIAPMIAGLPALTALRRDFPHLGIFVHPAMAGAARITPPLLLGRLFRMMGADATIFPNHGGLFGYSPQTCRELAEAARSEWHGMAPSLPVPAGGMTTERVDEMLDFYGPHVILLIGGDLLAAGPRLTQETLSFTTKVAGHVFV